MQQLLVAVSSEGHGRGVSHNSRALTGREMGKGFV